MTLVLMHAATTVGLVPSMIGDKPPYDEQMWLNPIEASSSRCWIVA